VRRQGEKNGPLGDLRLPAPRIPAPSVTSVRLRISVERQCVSRQILQFVSEAKGDDVGLTGGRPRRQETEVHGFERRVAMEEVVDSRAELRGDQAAPLLGVQTTLKRHAPLVKGRAVSRRPPRAALFNRRSHHDLFCQNMALRGFPWLKSVDGRTGSRMGKCMADGVISGAETHCIHPQRRFSPVFSAHRACGPSLEERGRRGGRDQHVPWSKTDDFPGSRPPCHEIPGRTQNIHPSSVSPPTSAPDTDWVSCR